MPTFEEYYARVNQLAPNQYDRERVRAEYESRFGKAEVPTTGPSFDEYKANVERLAPGKYDEDRIRQEYDKRYNIGFMQSLGRGLGAGMMDMAESVGSGLRFFGAEDTGKMVEDYWRQKGEGFAPPPALQGSIVDDPSLLLDPNWYGYNLTRMLPFTASMYLPGLGAYRAATAAKMAPAAAKAIGLAAGTIPSGFTEALPGYRQMLAEGMDPNEARLRTLGSAGGIAALNALPLGTAMSGIKSLPLKSFLTALGEAGTETLEEGVQAAAEGKDVMEALRQGVNVAPPAFLMGLLGGGAGHYTEQRNQDQLNALRQQHLARSVEAALGGGAMPSQLGAYYPAPAGFDTPYTSPDLAFAQREADQTRHIPTPEEAYGQREEALATQKAAEQEQITPAPLTEAVQTATEGRQAERAYTEAEPTAMELAMRRAAGEAIPTTGAVQQPVAAYNPQIDTPEFKAWFKKSQVSTKGKPIIAYAGHSNLEMYGEAYDPGKSTAGGFYASEDSDIASNYALGKIGAKEYYENGAQYRFKYKNGKFGKKLWQIEFDEQQQEVVRQYMQEIGYDIESYWNDNRQHDASARRALARGGVRDAQSVWQFLEYMGDNVAYPETYDPSNPKPHFMRQRETAFEELLDRLGIEWRSYDWSQPGVMPVYLSIQNPLDADKPFPQDLLDALKKKASRERRQGTDDDQWTKHMTLKEWIGAIESGDEYWTTQIPSAAIDIIKQFGYDGIKERGQKTSDAPRSERQINWIAFDPEQIKSATGNRGTFDPNNPSIVAERTDATPETRQLQQDILTGTRQMKGMLANAINREAVETGTVNLIGKTVKTPEDLATLAQVYRDPRWETLRYIFTRNNKIVGVVGVSHRLPAASAAFPVDTGGMKWLMEQMKSHNATGYWMLHNHPSGNAGASDADIMLTHTVHKSVKGLKGHVIIDSNQYGTILPAKHGKDVEQNLVHKDFGKDKILARTLPHPVLDKQAESPEQVAQVGAEFQHKDGYVVLIGRSGGQGQVRAVMEVPEKTLEHPTRGYAAIRRFARQTGSSDVFLTHVSRDMWDRMGSDRMRNLIRHGFLLDVVHQSGNSLLTAEPYLGQAGGQTLGVKGPARVTESVRQAEGEYNVAGTDMAPFLSRLNSSKDAQDMLMELMRRNEPGYYEARGGRKTVEQMQAEAQAILGRGKMDLSKISPAQFEAGRALMDKAMTELNTLAKQAEIGSDQDLVAFETALEKFEMLAKEVLGFRADWGRIGVMMQQQASQAKDVKAMLAALGGRDNIEAKAAALSALVEEGLPSDRMAKAAVDLNRATIWDYILEIWINGLLSGPQTHAVNVMSNSLVAAMNVADMFTAALTSKDVTLADAVAFAAGSWRGLFKGAALAKHSFLTEEGSTEGSKIEARKYQAIPPKYGGKIIRIPGRALLAGDEFFKAIARHGIIEMKAHKMGLEQGLTGQALTDFVEDTLLNPPADLKAHADAFADYATFTNRLGNLGRSVQKILNDHPYLRFIVPFVRTPMNIVKYAVGHSPFAPLLKEVRMSKARGGADWAVAKARIINGTMLSLATVMLAAMGKITGGGPDDPREKALKYKTGWQPYSILIGDQYYAFNRLEPLGMLMGMAADLTEIWDAASNNQKANLVAMLSMSFAKNITSKTWLRGMSDAVNAIADPDRHGERWIQNFAGTVVPTGVAQIARTQDPYLREVNSIMDQIRSRIPGMRQKLPLRLDPFGEPIKQEGGVGPDILSPIYKGTYTGDPVAEEILRMRAAGMDVSWSKPSKKYQGIELEPGAYNELVQTMGQPAYQVLRAVISHPGYQELPLWVREDVLSSAINKFRSMGRKYWLTGHPEIIRSIIEAKVRRMAG